RMAYSRTRYGTGYYIFQQYVGGAKLSQPIKSWDGATAPDKDVVALVARAGEDIAPQVGAGVQELSGSLSLAAAPQTLAEIKRGPAVIRARELSPPKRQAVAFSRARLRITWDKRAQPSVDVPVALFFGAGTLYNRDGREYLVKALPMTIRFDPDRV